jgi:hypothetical protein
MMLLDELIARLRRDTHAYSTDVAPHPKAAELRLPDKSLAPASVRAWAAFDNRYPTYLSHRRSDVVIADAKGKVLAMPMKKILREVCTESIRDELDGDEETLSGLKELVRELAEELPGYGVMLDPNETPDRILWFGPEEAIVLWYEHDEFGRREPFAEWVASLF